MEQILEKLGFSTEQAKVISEDLESREQITNSFTLKDLRYRRKKGSQNDNWVLIDVVAELGGIRFETYNIFGVRSRRDGKIFVEKVESGHPEVYEDGKLKTTKNGNTYVDLKKPRIKFDNRFLRAVARTLDTTNVDAGDVLKVWEKNGVKFRKISIAEFSVVEQTFSNGKRSVFPTNGMSPKLIDCFKEWIKAYLSTVDFPKDDEVTLYTPRQKKQGGSDTDGMPDPTA